MIRITILAAAGLALGACDKGRDGAPVDAATATETALPDMTPAGGPSGAAGSDGAASIMRQDIEAEPIAAPTREPLRPLVRTIGFGDAVRAVPEDAEAGLRAILVSPQMAAGGPIVLRGHSDNGGSGPANLTTSRRRADAVKAWLTDHGVAAKRITVIAFGEANPAYPNRAPDGTVSEANRAKNRRVEIAIAVPPRTAGPVASETPTVAEQISDDNEDAESD